MTARRHAADGGFAMAALLVSMSVMAIVMSAALPVWQTWARREKEAELIFRGEQYARAISLFQRKYANTNPPSVDLLLKERFLRKKYKDPITGEDFQLVTPTTELPGRDTPIELQRSGRAAGGRGRSSSSGRADDDRQPGRASSSGRSSRGTTAGRSGAQGRGGSATGRGGAGMQAGATGGIMGVMSKSTEKSFRLYNGAEHYNEWIFMPTAASNRAGAPSGAQAPGIEGRSGDSGARGRSGSARGRTGGLGGAGRGNPTTRGGRGFGRGQ